MHETVAFLLLSAVLLGGMVLMAAEQIEVSRSFFRGLALESSLDSLFYTAEALPVGSRERVEINIPGGITGPDFELFGDGWVFRLVFDGLEIKRPVNVRLAFVPADLIERPGARSVIIEKESKESAVVREQ